MKINVFHIIESFVWTRKKNLKKGDCSVNSEMNKRWGDNPGKAGANRLWLVLFYAMFIAYAFMAIKVILFKTIPLSALFHSGIMSALRSINIIPFNTIIEFVTSENIDMGRALANIGGEYCYLCSFGDFRSLCCTEQASAFFISLPAADLICVRSYSVYVCFGEQRHR